MDDIAIQSVRAETKLGGIGGAFDPGGSLRFPIAADELTVGPLLYGWHPSRLVVVT